MQYIEVREQICDVCHKMWQLGWVAANDGNVSVKLPDGNFLVTPTGMLVKQRICDGSLGDVKCGRTTLAWYRPDNYYDGSDWKGT